MRTAAVGDMQHHLTKMESTRASLEASHMTWGVSIRSNMISVQ
jgi:hypothetical protein